MLLRAVLATDYMLLCSPADAEASRDSVPSMTRKLAAIPARHGLIAIVELRMCVYIDWRFYGNHNLITYCLCKVALRLCEAYW